MWVVGTPQPSPDSRSLKRSGRLRHIHVFHASRRPSKARWPATSLGVTLGSDPANFPSQRLAEARTAGRRYEVRPPPLLQRTHVGSSFAPRTSTARALANRRALWTSFLQLRLCRLHLDASLISPRGPWVHIAMESSKLQASDLLFPRPTPSVIFQLSSKDGSYRSPVCSQSSRGRASFSERDTG